MAVYNIFFSLHIRCIRETNSQKGCNYVIGSVVPFAIFVPYDQYLQNVHVTKHFHGKIFLFFLYLTSFKPFFLSWTHYSDHYLSTVLYGRLITHCVVVCFPLTSFIESTHILFSSHCLMSSKTCFLSSSSSSMGL